MAGRLRFLFNRLGERLWVKPLLMCILSVGGVFVSRLADLAPMAHYVPAINVDSLETLLQILSSSMLVIATLAVTTMVSAYASASNTATPRSFPLIIADDSSQNALSTFVGAFIFGVVTLIAVQNGFYEKAGRFSVFVITLTVFVIVIVTFVRWMDCIARLGRLGNTIVKVEQAAREAIEVRRRYPYMGAVPVPDKVPDGEAVAGDRVGYVQLVDVAVLQEIAEKSDTRIRVLTLPGTLVTPGRPVAELIGATVDDGAEREKIHERIVRSFVIDKNRTFDEDPRFGLITLSQIASRALSPAVNDPGTAIDIIATFVRLLSGWFAPRDGEPPTPVCDRVWVPGIALDDIFDDAFGAIARDGASLVEIGIRLQKAFAALEAVDNAELAATARRHARRALARAESGLSLEDDRLQVRSAAAWAGVD